VEIKKRKGGPGLFGIVKRKAVYHLGGGAGSSGASRGKPSQQKKGAWTLKKFTDTAV